MGGWFWKRKASPYFVIRLVFHGHSVRFLKILEVFLFLRVNLLLHGIGDVRRRWRLGHLAGLVLVTAAVAAAVVVGATAVGATAVRATAVAATAGVFFLAVFALALPTKKK